MAELNIVNMTAEEVERSLALIEKGQQLAGHYPDEVDLTLARSILTGEVSPEDARKQVNEEIADLVRADKGRRSIG